MNDYIVVVQEGLNGEVEMHHWYFECSADDAAHAQEQALDHSDGIHCVAVYERILWA